MLIDQVWRKRNGWSICGWGVE